MSKSLIGTGDISSLASYPLAQQKGFTVSSKPVNTSRSATNQVSTTQNKVPRNTHKHHRKPEASLSHLLNFSYDRPAQNSRQANPRRSNRVTPSFGRGSGHHPLDKAHFVNANYRFVVHPSGDYRANLIESDIPIPWENVLQVLASIQSQCTACPICLEDVPVSPRMAKCGHVFCLPCALKYLDSEDIKTGKTTGKWRKCPICFDGVYANELRPVKWFAGDDTGLPVKGEDVTLQLIMRRTGSMFALPRDSLPFNDDIVPWHNQADALEYARFVKGDADYMAAESQREVMDMILMKEQDAQNFGDVDEWTGTAIQFVEDRAATFESMGSAPKTKFSTVNVPKTPRKPIKYETASEGPGIFDPQIHEPKLVTAVPEDTVVDAYFFYQPRTGSHYYLSPLDIRILKRAFGAFVNFPSALVAKLEHASTTTVDEELRRRSKYLSHLPLGCEVTFLECDWTGVLSEDILATFKVDVDKRRKKRHDKAVTEETARRRAQAVEERRQRAGLGELQWQDEDTSYFARNDESNTYEIFAEPMPASNASISSGSLPNGSLERRSIWGTMLPASQEPFSAPPEDDEWKEQMEQFYQESAVAASLESSGTPGKKTKSKKKKLVLMSSGGGRGMG